MARLNPPPYAEPRLCILKETRLLCFAGLKVAEARLSYTKLNEIVTLFLSQRLKIFKKRQRAPAFEKLT